MIFSTAPGYFQLRYTFFINIVKDFLIYWNFIIKTYYFNEQGLKNLEFYTLVNMNDNFLDKKWWVRFDFYGQILKFRTFFIDMVQHGRLEIAIKSLKFK